MKILTEMQELVADFFFYLGDTKLICWSTGPTDPILSKSRKY